MAGGDFFEVLQAGDQVFDYVVADVSGHDADASLVTSALKVLLHQGRATLSSPMDTLRMINGALFSSFPDNIYLTLAWVRLNRNRKTLTTWSAGHPPVILLSPGTPRARCLGAPGDVLGIYESVELEESSCSVLPGDRILLFTDGLIELPLGEASSSRAAGLDCLGEGARARMDRPLAEMVDGAAVDMMRRAREVTDDLLLLGVEV
jgi:sigma-B regulation protein RsbU (phosphoserine phosphatase)